MSDIRTYNYHNWSQYIVLKQEQVPKSRHFAAILFDKYTPCSGYENEGYQADPRPMTVYFAFPTKELLSQWVLEATQDKKQFFFFEVPKMGEVKISVNLEIT
jgi:hypothetical protein